ncbi:MAG: siphovirus ReqiPepy6 Gp37-like family protein [Butyrivibrio sp.]|nr:siphovirus ReqiPepy6 Gp37-like family protein [Butyrivibrio sp.]
MEIYILNRDIEILGIFSTYESIIWEPCLHEPGTFKAEFIFSSKMNQILQLGNLLYKTDELEPGIITRKYLKLNEKGEETILIQGYMASRYLNQRIIWDKMIMNGTVECVMRELVYEQTIVPKDAKRIIPRLELGELQGYGETISKQISYDNLQLALTELSKQSELGYRLRLDIAERKFLFEVYKGVDRTSHSAVPCVFTRDYNNVYAQEYSEDITNYRNVCLIGGKGEDSDRVMATVGNESGLDRYEMFYNASGLSDKDITDNEYIEQIKQKGEEKLTSYYAARSFESRINQSKTLNYALGDYVTCTDRKWGIIVDTQIKKIEKAFSKKEMSIEITFGDDVPTLIQLIKAKE